MILDHALCQTFTAEAKAKATHFNWFLRPKNCSSLANSRCNMSSQANQYSSQRYLVLLLYIRASFCFNRKKEKRKKPITNNRSNTELAFGYTQAFVLPVQ